MCKKNTESHCYVFFSSNEYPFASCSPIKLITYLCDIKLNKIVFICSVDIIECIDELCVITNSGSWGTSVINFDSLTLYLKRSKIFSSFHFVTDWLGVTHILVDNSKNSRPDYFSKLYKQWNFQKNILEKQKEGKNCPWFFSLSFSVVNTNIPFRKNKAKNIVSFSCIPFLSEVN